MPSRVEHRPFFRSKAWREIRDRVLARAGNCCENCHVPNRKTVLRAFSWWTPASNEAAVWMAAADRRIVQLPWRAPGVLEPNVACFLAKSCRWVWIVLTVAHLDNDPAHNDDSNLKVLCQYCRLERIRAARLAARKAVLDQARPILAACEAEL